VSLKKNTRIDVIAAGLFLLLFVIISHIFQYHGVMGDSDLYLALNGIIDGARMATGLGSNFHYGRDFSFGYILALYALVPVHVLSDPDKLIALINNVGFYSAIFGLIFFWLSVSVLHGFRAAFIALALFAFSPMVLDLATSGHQILTATAFLWAAAACLFWPLAGWRALLAAIAGTFLLICGLCIRAEIVLAVPYLVLTRVNLTSWRTFLRSVAVNAVSPSAAFVTFLVLRQSIAVFPRSITDEIDLGTVFERFFSWSNVVRAFAFMPLGCGIATVVVAVGLGFLVIAGKIRPRVADAYKVTLEQLIGPIALVLVPFVFWLGNPAPSRHFILVLAGFSILIGWAISNWPALRFAPVLTAVIGLIVANQVLSEAVRPTLLRMNAAGSAFHLPPEFYTTFDHAPLGWTWQHHAAVDARWHQVDALGDILATSCDANTVIFTDEAEHFIHRFFAAGWRLDPSKTFIHGANAFSGNLGAHYYVIMPKWTAYPKDVVAEVLADPSFDDYKLYADPYTISTYEKMAIPDRRLAQFGC
jgi:hypothetical protein